MTNGQGPLARSLLGLFAGMVALVLVTALLSSAVSSHNAEKRSDALTTQLAEANQQLAALRAAQAASDRRAAVATLALRRQQATDRVLRRQQHLIFTYIHKLGVIIPPALLEPQRSGSVTRPKVVPARPPHRHRHRGSQGHTASTGSTDLLAWLCALLGMTSCPHL